MVYGNEFNSSSQYLGTRIALTAFNRTWKLGRPRPKADCSLDSPLLSRGIKWDADAQLKERKEEDDVLHASKIPTFNGALSTEDSEALCSFLTVPGLRVSLVLEFFGRFYNRIPSRLFFMHPLISFCGSLFSFFSLLSLSFLCSLCSRAAEKSRLTSLFSETLRKILWSSTFSPDSWPKPASLDNETGEAVAPPQITEVPSTNPSRLWCRQGLLFVELRTSPEVILKSVTEMTKNAVTVASINEFTTPYADTFFFVVRLAIAVLNYARTVPETFSSNRHWPKDGFLSPPSEKVLSSLKSGVAVLSSVLLNLAIPLCQKWIDQSLAASNGMETAEAVDAAGDDKNANIPVAVVEVDDGNNAAARLAEDLKRQGLAQEMAITANSHMVLLSSPSLCGGSSFDYSTDDVGTQVLAASLKSMAYIVEWYGKGLGLRFYGTSEIPPSTPPQWNGKKAHMVCGGFLRGWPTLDIDTSPLMMDDYDPGILGVAPHELWSTLAQRRRATHDWFQKCIKENETDRISYVLSGIMSNSLGDPYIQWPLEDKVSQKEVDTRIQFGVFAHPNGNMRVDTVFAELNFLTVGFHLFSNTL